MKELYATIDLGSNSFHLLVANLEYGELKVLESTSDKVMLAKGLSRRTGISDDAKQRGLDCLRRFSQRLENIPKQNIRIVGTNTLRAAVNSDNYISQLENELEGVRIDIVSGIEEARLIYLGVNHSWSSTTNKVLNLVIDIGGGSTEFIIGYDFNLKTAESLPIGCVAYRRFFENEIIDQACFDSAVKAAKFELASISSNFINKSRQQVIGSAGTFKAIEKILVEQGLVVEGISYTGLIQLKEQILEFSRIGELVIAGLKSDRITTIVPGVAIAIAIFESLEIDIMLLARGGLREGILYDLLGKREKENIRQRSINALCNRYDVSRRWRHLTNRISNHLVKTMQSSDGIKLNKEGLNFLDWSTQSFRIGLAISHNQYQVHSAYLVKHSELSGFSLRERILLSALLMNHRKKIDLKLFENKRLTSEEVRQLVIVVFLLRLVTIVSQNGKFNQASHLSISIKEDNFLIVTSDKWLTKNSLILHAFNKEKKYWSKIGINLGIKIL